MTIVVRSTFVSSTVTAIKTPARVKAFYILSVAGGGTLTLKDGGSSGPVKHQMSLPLSTAQPVQFAIPDEGVKFNTNVYMTSPAGVKVTLFFDA